MSIFSDKFGHGTITLCKSVTIVLFLHSDAASLEGAESSVSDQSSKGCIGEEPRVSTGTKPCYLEIKPR